MWRSKRKRDPGHSWWTFRIVLTFVWISAGEREEASEQMAGLVSFLIENRGRGGSGGGGGRRRRRRRRRRRCSRLEDVCREEEGCKCIFFLGSKFRSRISGDSRDPFEKVPVYEQTQVDLAAFRAVPANSWGHCPQVPFLL